jgi:hypothetical protein
MQSGRVSSFLAIFLSYKRVSPIYLRLIEISFY